MDLSEQLLSREVASLTSREVLCYTGFMARDSTPAYTDDLSRFTDVEVYGMYEDETDPERQQLLSDECKLRAQIYCAVQEVN